ncbi:MAG: metal-binding protein, partial [Rhodobacterales bacterium]|nr:metal-binding protein [Rhodobacterales bacterium]
YFVSGLVPVEILNRLMAQQPAITGITLPGMPMNAPGMAPEKTGMLRVYAFGPEGVAVYSDE